MEAIDPSAQAFLEAKKATEKARAVLLARLEAIKGEKKTAFAKWKAEEDRIHELLRTRVKTTRPRKPTSEPAPEATKHHPA